MGEQIACPVCTLFLHPGMDLADHLETHPKEKVIKALVALASGKQQCKPPIPAAQVLQRSHAPSMHTAPDAGLLNPNESRLLAPSQHNVMIVNSQSTTVYQSSETAHHPIIPQVIQLTPPPLRLFSAPRESSVKFLPPPPAYGAAINQIRSQNTQNICSRFNQLSTNETPNYINFTPNQNSFEPLCNDRSNSASPRLLISPRNASSPRPNSSPSVLRFADSPVTAHYVERENGDFIVQETPRHIVECVEKDDGEFSVIEKVIKSPPSLVHFQQSDNNNEVEFECTDNVAAVANEANVETESEVGNEEQDEGPSNVKVISNVKLAPKESLGLMENIMATTPGVELLWTGMVEFVSDGIKKEEQMLEESSESAAASQNGQADEDESSVEKKIVENPPKSSELPEAHNGEEDQDETIVENKIIENPQPSAATSVIRLASVQKSSRPEEIVPQKAIKSEKMTPSNYNRDIMKRPYKKKPKKLVVKFKNPPQVGNVEDQKMETDSPQPGSSQSQENCSLSSPNVMVEPKIISETVENKMNETSMEKVEELHVTDDEASMIIAEIEIKMHEKKEHRDEDMAVDSSNEKNSEEANISARIIDSETLQKLAEKADEVALDASNMPLVIVHEPTTLDEPPMQNVFEPRPFRKLSDASTNENNFAKVLDECMHNTHEDSYSAQLATVESTEQCPANSGEQDPARSELATLTSFPSTSFSKPSASSFAALREQTDFQNSHSYNDYPFSFLYTNDMDKGCLSPIYPSEDQSWQRYGGPTFQQTAPIQLPEMDLERSSYIDLDACKKNTSTDTVPSVDALNIRTDEKMPAKGEISEQESNGEIDLSWSQALYNDTQRQNNQLENYGTRESGSFSNEEFFFSPQNLTTDTKPSIKSTETTTEEKPEPLLTKEKEKRCSAVKKRKTFQCDHCLSVFSKLKDRNCHLLDKHGYKRVNRRLIRELPPATVTTDQTEAQNLTDDAIDFKKPELTAIASIESSHLPRTKYDAIRAGVYRMLMNFNLSVLQQKQNVDVDKALFDAKSFCCYTCKRDFISVKSFDEHLAEHPAECFTCSKKFTRWMYFSIHLKRHLGWKDFACTVCSKKFVIRSALIEHMRMHTGVTPLKCKFCDKHFKRYSNLTQHKRVCHQTKNSKKKDYVCHCGEVLPSKARFLWHKETHDTKPKCCPYCRDRFIHSNSLRRHIRLAHSDKFCYTEPAECPVCNQVYAKTSLKAHMSTHSMDTQHECVICNKSFSTKWNLKIHSWVHASRTAKPFKCDLCVKAFVREIDYKNHMNAHKQIKPYTCEYCGCKFIRKYNYMRHSREHHGQKKFGCDLCGKLFHRHYYLIEHRRTHTGERPFLCTICGKSSTTKTNHNKHLKIHHSRDPFTTET